MAEKDDVASVLPQLQRLKIKNKALAVAKESAKKAKEDVEAKVEQLF